MGRAVEALPVGGSSPALAIGAAEGARAKFHILPGWTETLPF